MQAPSLPTTMSKWDAAVKALARRRRSHSYNFAAGTPNFRWSSSAVQWMNGRTLSAGDKRKLGQRRNGGSDADTHVDAPPKKKARTITSATPARTKRRHDAEPCEVAPQAKRRNPGNSPTADGAKGETLLHGKEGVDGFDVNSDEDPPAAVDAAEAKKTDEDEAAAAKAAEEARIPEEERAAAEVAAANGDPNGPSAEIAEEEALLHDEPRCELLDESLEYSSDEEIIDGFETDDEHAPNAERADDEEGVDGFDADDDKDAPTVEGSDNEEGVDGFDADDDKDAPADADDDEGAPIVERAAADEDVDGFDADDDEDAPTVEGANNEDQAPPAPLRRSARIAAQRGDADETRVEAKSQKKARKVASRPSRRSLRISLSLSGGSVRKTRSGRVYGVVI